ncbi:MAG: hypothetical protein ACTHM0_11525 [Sphingomonas sp.]
MSRGPDAATQLARAIERSGPGVTVSKSEAAPWASVTFAGARHRLTVEARATAGFDRWLAALPEAEFALRGHLVAELAVTTLGHCEGRAKVMVEALTVED